MGKIRVKTLGDEAQEQAQANKTKKRREEKKAKKAHVKGVGLKGGQQITAMEGVELKTDTEITEAAEEKSSFTVVLASAGEQKIAVMKVVKEVLGLGLKEAKDIVDGAPVTLKEGVKKADADELKKKIEEAGGKIELK